MTVSLSKDPLDEKPVATVSTMPPDDASDLVTPPRPAPAPADMSNNGEEDWDLVIKPRRGWIGVDWRELISHRELLLFLVWRDVKVKYKQAVLGFAWAIIVPMIQVLLFTVIGNFAGFDKRTPPGVPYAVFIYAGLLPWLFIQTSINNGGMSLVSQQSLIAKIYLPRLFIPLSTIGSALVDFALSAAVLVGVMIVYRFAPPAHVWAVIPLMLLAILLSAGFALSLSALTVTFRDVRFLIPFLAQTLMWASAVVYPDTIFGPYRKWLAINPVYGVISGFKAAILGDQWHYGAIASSAVTSLALLIFGLFYFKRAERRFADIA